QAEAYYDEFVTAVSEERWADAETARRKADFLAAQHKATVESLGDVGGLDQAQLAAFEARQANLHSVTEGVYRDHIMPAAEARVAEAQSYGEQVEQYLTWSEEARSYGNLEDAHFYANLAAEAQATQDALFLNAVGLTTEFNSARDAGLLETLELPEDWAPVSATADGTSVSRPKFLDDAIDGVANTRTRVNNAVLDAFGDQINSMATRIRGIESQSVHERRETLQEASKLYHDAQKILETYDETGASSETINVNLDSLRDAKDTLEQAMRDSNVSFGADYTESVKSVTEENPQWFEENGSLHSALGYAGEIAMIAGVTSDVVKVLLANDRGEALSEVAGGWIGGLAAGAVVGLAAGAVFTGPAGWLVVGALELEYGALGANFGSWAGKGLYDAFSHHDPNHPQTDVDDIGGGIPLLEPQSFGPIDAPEPTDPLDWILDNNRDMAHGLWDKIDDDFDDGSDWFWENLPEHEINGQTVQGYDRHQLAAYLSGSSNRNDLSNVDQIHWDTADLLLERFASGGSSNYLVEEGTELDSMMSYLVSISNRPPNAPEARPPPPASHYYLTPEMADTLWDRIDDDE
ncbi:MAG: hypothetical protein AAF449_22930, partial [Myxococcota bacterium]